MKTFDGRRFPASSARYKNWEAMAFPYVYKCMRGKIRFPIKDFLWGEFEFHFENKKALPDLSNCLEGPQDLLQNIGVIKDDKQIVSIEARRFIGSKPKSIIRLFEAKIGESCEER